MSYLSGCSPLHKGGAYTPTSASLWIAPVGPALHVLGALPDPTVVLFWLDVFDSKNWNPQQLELASCPEGVAGSTSCNRTWSGYCGSGIPRFPGHIMDIVETDLGRNSQKVRKHNTTLREPTRPDDQTFETELVRTAWNQRPVGQSLQTDAALVVHILLPFLLQRKAIIRARWFQRRRLKLYALGWRRILHVQTRHASLPLAERGFFDHFGITRVVAPAVRRGDGRPRFGRAQRL